MKQFVIVGAGFAGLYLAYKLLKHEYNVTIIEKEKILGGRMYTEQIEIDGQTFFIEGGAGVIRSDEDDMIDLLKELNVPCNFWKSSTKIIYHDKKSKILDYNYRILLDKICRYSCNNKSFFEVLDETNISNEEKIGVMIGTTYSELFDTNSKDVCDENDFNEFLLQNGYEFGKPKAWSDLTKRLEEEILRMNGKIINHSSVIEIGDSYVITNKKDKYIFDELVITCPYHFLKKIKTPKSLNPWKAFMDEYHHETDYLRIYSYFEKPLELESKIATNLSIRRVIPITKQLIMTVYTDGIDAQDIYKLHKDEKKLSLYIEGELEKLLERKIPKIKKNWSIFWNKGISNWKPSSFTIKETIEIIRNPVDHIYFCGDTYSLHPGWLEGAMESCEFIIEKFDSRNTCRQSLND